MATYEELIKQGYSYSDEAKKYKQQLDYAMSNKPGDYQSQYTAQLDDLYSQIANRKPFTYDLNGDMLYQQYKNQYQTLGKQAMKDTMGQAAALTGGYGSTYGQAVGQQQYNAYLSQLNDKIPELYSLARSNYDAEGNDLYQRYGLVQSRDDTDYGRWKDQLASWQDDVNLYNSLFQNERQWDYGLWQDNISYLMQLAQMAAAGGGGGRGGRGRGGYSEPAYANALQAGAANAYNTTVSGAIDAIRALANGFGANSSKKSNSTNSQKKGTVPGGGGGKNKYQTK